MKGMHIQSSARRAMPPFRTVMFCLCTLLTVIGAGILMKGVNTPEWTDENEALTVMMWPAPEDLTNKNTETYYTYWLNKIQSMRTNKWPKIDLGCTLITLGVSIISFIYILGIRKLRDLKNLECRLQRYKLFIYFNIVWLGLGTTSAYQLVRNHERGMYPIWAEAIIIPIIYIGVITFAWGLIFSVIFWTILKEPHELPVNLLIWRQDTVIRSWLHTLILIINVILVTGVLSLCLRYGAFAGLPFCFMWVYASICFRALALSKKIP